jgi:hypothetical protein
MTNAATIPVFDEALAYDPDKIANLMKASARKSGKSTAVAIAAAYTITKGK